MHVEMVFLILYKLDNTTLDMEQCLLDQSFIKDEKKNVAQYVTTFGDVEVSGFKRVTLG
jgi:elongation factor Ts